MYQLLVKVSWPGWKLLHCIVSCVCWLYRLD